MPRTPALTERIPLAPAGWRRLGIALNGAAAVAFVALLLRGFANWPLSSWTGGGAAVTGAVLAVACDAALRQTTSRFLRGLLLAGALACTAAGWWVVGRSPGLLASGYAALITALVFAGLEGAARLGRAGDAGDAGERLRLVALGLVALFAVHPFVTTHLIGVSDGRWYAYMFEDFLTQWRQGVFPVFVGQGELAFQGPVHPFRSAPLLLYLGGMLDVLTLRTLGAVAIAHLVVITAALAAALGMYHGLARLATGNRWHAALVAAAYVLSPALLAPLAMEMMMTFLAAAILPHVVVANALAGQASPRYGRLAALLAVLWYCHAITALWCTLLTAVVQTLHIATSPRPRDFLGPAARGLALFSGLTCHYVATMVELQVAPGAIDAGRMGFSSANSSPADLAQFAGLLLVLGGTARHLFVVRGWALVATGAGLLLLAWVRPGAALWFGVALTGVLAADALAPRSFSPRARLACLGLGFASALGLGVALLPGPTQELPPTVAEGLARNRLRLLAVLRPLPPSMRWAEFQPGWTLLGLLGLAVAAALVRPGRLRLLLLAPAVVLALLQLPVPGLSALGALGLPPGFARSVALTMSARELPVFAAFAAVSGFLALATLPARRTLQFGALGVLLAGVLWSAGQQRFFARSLQATTASPEETARALQPAHRRIFPYVFDLVPRPAYAGQPHQDWRLEHRLLDDEGHVRIGPAEIVTSMPAAGTRSARVEIPTANAGTAPLALDPPLALPPRGPVFLVFDFGATLPRGRLEVRAGDVTQSCLLPAPGAKAAFGSGREGVIALENNTAEEVALALRFTPEISAARAAASEPRPFATVRLVPFLPEQSPIAVRSLLPYRIRVRASEAGWLETPRVFAPGYTATVDGQPAVVQRSREHLVAVRVPAGEHEVELRFVGTARLRLTFALSAATALVAGFIGLRRRALSIGTPAG